MDYYVEDTIDPLKNAKIILMASMIKYHALKRAQKEISI